MSEETHVDIALIKLGSNSGVYAPGLVNWIQNGYRTDSNKKYWINMLVTGYNLRPVVAKRLCAGQIKFRINPETDAVEFHAEADAILSEREVEMIMEFADEIGIKMNEDSILLAN